MVWIGRILTVILVLLLLMDGVMKLVKPKAVVDATTKLGFPENTIVPMGIALTVSVILYAIPKTAYLGAILLTGYLGGAVCTNVHAANGWGNILTPAIVGAVVWFALYLRDPRIRRLIPFSS